MIAACDPGVYGALALYDGARLVVRDMPIYFKAAGARGNDRAFIDSDAAIATLKGFQLLGAEHFFVEKTGGYEGQGVHAAFMFGHGAGGVTWAAKALGYKVEEVPPGTWKSAMRCPSSKAAAIARATELLPAYVNLWAPVRGNGSEAVRSGRAEAGMLALYGHAMKGKLPC